MSDQASSWVAKFGVGIVLVLIAVNLFSGLIAKKVGIPGVFEIEFGPKETPHPTPAPVTPQPTQAPATPQPSMQPVAPLPSPQGVNTNPAQQQLPAPDAGQFRRPLAPTQGYACPYVAGIFWIPYPNTWYGPFGGYFIGWYSYGGFGVWNPYTYQPVNYPDPYGQAQRNTWFNLTGTPFNVCIDSSNKVYGQYWPY